MALAPTHTTAFVLFDEYFNWHIIRHSAGDLFGYFLQNLKLTVVAEAIALCAGLIVAILRSLPGDAAKPVRFVTIAYIDVFRGIPLLLVLVAVAFGLPALGPPFSDMSLFWLAIIAIVLTYTAYLAEVFRAGIESLHVGQLEAARALGLNQRQTLRFVVVPQAVRRVIPPLLNDFIALTKDTALVSVIGLSEVMRASQELQGNTFNASGFTVAAFYFVIVTVPLARLTDRMLARKTRYQRRAQAA
jgi:polar amino acid transport system permease protein